jgi:hypothetical protein
MTKDEALRLALETFESMSHKESIFAGEFDNEITAIKAALEAKDEPVAWVCMKSEMHDIDFDQPEIDAIPVGTMLYTTPPQRTWVGLTDEEIEQGCKESWVTLQAWQSAVWWAEAKLKEKNT